MTLRHIARNWWPLAVSWGCMAIELPALSAVVARLPDQRIQLAAYGSIVLPLALIIESPIIMLLAASTALSHDWASYQKVRRFMMAAGAVLTVLHAAVALTPLYYVVVRTILGVPEAIVEPARLGLVVMIPWTWAIAYRRFHQGVLIRFQRSQLVGLGTFIRISTVILVLSLGYLYGRLPGVVVAASSVVSGVLVEALFVHLVVQPVLRGPLREAAPVAVNLTRRGFLGFYVPLVLTSLLDLVSLPIISASLSRMPANLASLAVWPVVDGLFFILQSAGVAYNEVVVALVGQPGAPQALRRFSWLLILATTGLTLAVTATPLARVWFVQVSALKDELPRLAQTALWLGLPLAALKVLQSWFGGRLLFARRTRGISEAVGLNLAVMIAVLWAGVMLQRTAGIYVGVAAVTLGMVAQTLWMGWRVRAVPLKSAQSA